MNINSLREDLRNFLFKAGVPLFGIGDIHAVLKGGTNSEAYWRGKFPAGMWHPTVLDAYNCLNGSQDEALLITPESHSLDASLTFAKNYTHVIGTAAPSLMNMRSRIGMSTTFTPMISLTGSGNSFHNLYFMHGTAVGDYVGFSVTGDRNSFYNCHFAGPLAAAQASDTNFRGVSLVTAAETYFKNCVFGNHTQSCDEPTALLTQGAGNGITICENCWFFMRVTAGQTDPTFVELDNQTDTGDIIFKNCTFIAQIGTPAVVFSVLGSGLGRIIIDAACQFIGVTALTDATDDSYLYIPRTFSTTTDTEANIGVLLAV